ncbi:MAG: hypothetical protein L6R39_002392, partial [Caloplaca ligustica]
MNVATQADAQNDKAVPVASDANAERDGEIAATEMSGESNSLESHDNKRMDLVYNIVSPHTFSWSADFLPALRAAGLHFDTVPVDTWLERLRSLSAKPSNAAASNPDTNPALKLIAHYESAFSKDEEKDGRVEFDIEGAMRASETLREAEDV